MAVRLREQDRRERGQPRDAPARRQVDAGLQQAILERCARGVIGENRRQRDFVAETAQHPGGVGGVAAGLDAQRGGAQFLVLGRIVRNAEDQVEDGGADTKDAGHRGCSPSRAGDAVRAVSHRSGS